MLNIEIDGKKISLINIYAPTQNYPQEQIKLIDTIEQCLSEFEVHDAFFAGDFNTQLNFEHLQQTSCQKSTSNAKDNYADKIYALTQTYNTIDIWYSKNPKSNKGTFRRNMYTARLDYWFIPQHLQNSDTSISIQPTPLSYHSLVTVKIGLPDDDRGPGFWHFNKMLLHDLNFVQEMRDHIQKTTLKTCLSNGNGSNSGSRNSALVTASGKIVKKTNTSKAYSHSFNVWKRFWIQHKQITQGWNCNPLNEN